MLKFGFIKNDGRLKKDTFNWTLYNLHYKGELKESSKILTQSLKSGDYQFRNSILTKTNEKMKPLHPNHRFLYETILQLNPSSIFEMGCGNGMHLHNLQILLPSALLSGIDLSNKQIKFLRQSYPDLKAEIKQADATIPFPPDFLPQADLAFTQAVIMHIHTGDLHLIALENLFKMAKKYVLLFESAKNHNFMDDIKFLKESGRIGWDKLFFHYRINEEIKTPASIICSREQLNYPVLNNYNIYFNN